MVPLQEFAPRVCWNAGTVIIFSFGSHRTTSNIHVAMFCCLPPGPHMGTPGHPRQQQQLSVRGTARKGNTKMRLQHPTGKSNLVQRLCGSFHQHRACFPDRARKLVDSLTGRARPYRAHFYRRKAYVPTVADPPVIAFDHPEGRFDGHDRPPLTYNILGEKTLLRCIGDYQHHIDDNMRRSFCLRSLLWVNLRYAIANNTSI